MDILLKFIAILLIASGIVWFIIFHLKKKKMFEDYVNKKLSNFGDDDIVPEDTAAEFMSSGIKTAVNMVLIHTLIPFGLILTGFLIIILSIRM